MADGTPISWRAIVYGSPVVGPDRSRIGTVREVLGSDAEDVFHGVRVLLPDRREVTIHSNDVVAITSDAVEIDLSPSTVAELAPYDEQATYHLASVGWLRKHLGWRKDAESDEEPG